MRISDILSMNARKFPGKVALIHEQQQFSFSELNERANRLAAAFLKLGVNAGDRVAMRAKNCPQFIEFFFTAAKCGAIAVPINPLLR